MMENRDPGALYLTAAFFPKETRRKGHNPGLWAEEGRERLRRGKAQTSPRQVIHLIRLAATQRRAPAGRRDNRITRMA